MVKKEEPKYFAVVNLSAIIILIIMIAIPLAFFFMKSQVVQGESFGFTEIIFSIIVGILSTAFILWDKSFIRKNPYLGAIIGIVVVGAFDYAVFFRYEGPYTTFFISLTSILVLAYLGYYFVMGMKDRKAEREDYYEENPTA